MSSNLVDAIVLHCQRSWSKLKNAAVLPHVAPAGTCFCEVCVGKKFLQEKSAILTQQRKRAPMLSRSLFTSWTIAARKSLPSALVKKLSRHVFPTPCGNRTMGTVPAAIEPTHIHKVASEGFSLQVRDLDYLADQPRMHAQEHKLPINLRSGHRAILIPIELLSLHTVCCSRDTICRINESQGGGSVVSNKLVPFL